jgi:hypothetical protein
MKETKIDPKSREVETRRIGLESRLKEDVKDAVEDPGCLESARKARFLANGEPEVAPTAADVK